MAVRLEFHSMAVNSHKFYELQEVGRKSGLVLAKWGRIGTAGDEKIYDQFEANKKLREKLRKGYKKVYGDF